MKKCTGLVLSLFLLAAACSSGGGGDDSSDPGTDSSLTREFATECGVNRGGSLKNPVSSSRVVSVVSVIDANSLIIREATGDLLVKLQGLTINDARSSQAVKTLQALSVGDVYFVPAKDGCTASVSGGGTALVGQLFTSNGVSFSEELLKKGLAGEIETTGTCGEESLSGCYSLMRETNKIKSAGDITDFLWKPRAESPYNPGNPVIHANPCNATVYVNGNALLDFGPGNGRCNTSRMFSSCGAFGSNIKVEIFDNESGLPYFNGSDPFVIVPNGCSRYEFKR